MNDEPIDGRKLSELLQTLEQDLSQVSSRRDDIRKHVIEHHAQLSNLDDSETGEAIIEMGNNTSEGSKGSGPWKAWLAAAAAIAVLVVGAVLIRDDQSAEIDTTDTEEILEDTSTTVPPTTEAVTTTTAAPTTTESTTTTSAPPAFQGETEDDLEAGVHEVDVLGGLEFQLSETTNVLTSGNCLILHVPDTTGLFPVRASVQVALVVSSGIRPATQQPLSTIDDWLALYVDQPVPQISDETITFLGEELQGYRIDGSFTNNLLRSEAFLNCASGLEFNADLGVIPSGFGNYFVAETEDGLLLVGYGSFRAEEEELARAFFDEIIPTLTPR